MEKSKDIVIEEGKAMLFGFIIALLICGFLLWAFNVKAQVLSSPLLPTTKTTLVTAKGSIQVDVETPVDKLSAIDLLAKYNYEISQKDQIISKYAKLYDSCKNK